MAHLGALSSRPGSGRTGPGRLVPSEEEAEAILPGAGPELQRGEGRGLPADGTSYVANRLWERLGIGRAIFQVASSRRVDAEAVERAIFSMVANRLLLKPLSKLAGCTWVAQRAFVDGCAELSDDNCYRAMDFLLDALGELQESVFFSVANLLN